MTSLTVGIIGRTEMLLAAARTVSERGHRIGLVATCRASGHENAGEQEFADFAQQHGAPFLFGRALTSPEGMETVRRASCHLALSMNWISILPEALLSAFPAGVFNAHPGDLPRYRGNACPNWAILRGEPQMALTIHRMSIELDAGPVALKKGFDLENRTIGDVYGWLAMAVPCAFADLVDAVANRSLVLAAQPNDTTAALRCYPRRPSDGHIAWQDSAENIDRLVRASGRPFAGAFTTLEGRDMLRVWASVPLERRETFLAVPGQVAFSVEGDPVIATGDGYLRLTDVSFDDPDRENAKTSILKSLRNRLV